MILPNNYAKSIKPYLRDQTTPKMDLSVKQVRATIERLISVSNHLRASNVDVSATDKAIDYLERAWEYIDSQKSYVERLVE